MKLNTDDIIILRNLDTGHEWPAVVTRITRGNRVECFWLRKDGSGGKDRFTKPTLIDPRRVTVVRVATGQEKIEAIARFYPCRSDNPAHIDTGLAERTRGARHATAATTEW